MTAPTLYFFRRVTSNNGCRQRPPDKKDTPGKNSHSGRKHKDRLTKLTSSIRRREVISKTLRVGRQRSTGQFVVTQSHGDHPLSTTAATARRPEAAHGDQGGKLSAVQQHRHKQARSVAGSLLVHSVAPPCGTAPPVSGCVRGRDSRFYLGWEGVRTPPVL